VKAAPKVYAKYVAANSRGEKSLLVECFNAIYGTMVAGLLYYQKFSSSLEKRGFVIRKDYQGMGIASQLCWQY
jgi:hypothetical protein